MSSEINLQDLMNKISTIENDIKEIKNVLLETKDANISSELPIEWQNWVNSNLRYGNDNNEIFNILLNHGFDYQIIEKFMRWQPTITEIKIRKIKQKNQIINQEFKLIKFNKILQDNPKNYKIENNFVEMYQNFDFLTPEFCNSLIESFDNDLFIKSTLTNKAEDTEFRTSSTYFLNIENNALYKKLDDKINETIGLDANLGELPQVQKYDVGEQFKAHTDYFENVEYNKCHLSRGGQRTWTFMLYLNDVEEGGETNFPKLQLEFKPQQGKALIWNNLINGEKENEYSLHQGKPIIKGVKYIITKWYREKMAN